MEVLLACIVFLVLCAIEALNPKLFYGSLGRIGSWLARLAVRLTAPALSLLKQAWNRDRLAVLGVGSAALAFLLWAWPYEWGLFYFYAAFSTERLPAAAAFLALSFILLLLRRR